MTDVTLARNPVEDAESLLDHVWYPSREGEPIPVDPVAIASKLGVQVFITAEIDADVAGALIKQPNADPVILVNHSDSRNRQRFTVAHELGHYISRESSDQAEFSFVDLRDPNLALGESADEVYANAFAANLLMPKAWMEKYRDEGQVAAAAIFGVSPEAMTNRFKSFRWV